MKKITKLTKRQEAAISQTIDAWIADAVKNPGIERVRRAVARLYKRLEQKPPITLVLDSPLATILGAIILNSSKDSQLGSQLHSQLGSQLHSQLGSQLHSKLHSQLGSQLGSQLHSKLRSQLGSQLHSKLRSQLDSQLHSKLRSQLDSQLGSQLGWYMCTWWRVNAAYALYARYIGVKFPDDTIWAEACMVRHIDMIVPYANVAFVSRKPVEIHWKNKQLHRDGGPAIKYADSYSSWSLHGVRVSKEIAETPANKLDAQLVVKEENAEVRREIIRKIGIEVIAQRLGAETLDSAGTYELINVNVGDGRKRPYLKMLNPSIETWHLEGVPPEIDTVEKALNWRNQTKERPLVLM